MFTNKDTLMVLWLGGTGFFILIRGILIRLGVYRSAYAMKGNPTFAPNKLGHLLIPGSLIPLLFAILPFLESEESRLRLFVYFMLPYQLIIIILGIWEPGGLNPNGCVG